MGSRIKRIFFGRSSSSNDVNLGARPYDSIVASVPPVKGSYPVAGNGPNVLEDIQRTRAKRQSITENIAAPAPSIPRRREDTVQRPRTAPHDGTPGGAHNRSEATKRTKGRTLSGFSMKSPQSILSNGGGGSSSSRQDFTRPSNGRPPLPASPSSPPPRDIQVYIPRQGAANLSGPFTPTFAQRHTRASSHASHKSHVDILDAQSSIRRTRETSLHRAKASGVRNYGEDVADRNIANFGERPDHKLESHSPELSSINSVYVPKKRVVSAESLSRAGSALGLVLETAGSSGDDTQLSHSRVPPRTTSIRSNASSWSGPRPAFVYPPRIDSASALSYGIDQSHDDRPLPTSNDATDRTGRAMSPMSSTASPMYDEPSFRYHQGPGSANSARAVPTPPIPERGRTRPAATTLAPQANLPPVSLPSKATLQTNSEETSGSPIIDPFSSKTNKRRSMPTTSQSTVPSPGFANHPPLPQAPDNGEASTRPPTSTASKRAGMIVERAKQPSGLERVVDLNDSVDTDVTSKTLPAVIHEHVIPTRHETRQEVITREIHNHDVYHRILPVIETEILPTKHYIPGKDRMTLIEIPESMVPKHTLTGRNDQNWHISKGPALGPSSSTCSETASRASTDSIPDGPVIGLVRSDPSSRISANARPSSTKSPANNRQPILSSKKEYITKEGIPKTEYVWRHPPVFETVMGDTQPMYINTGIGDLSGENYYSDEDEVGAEFGAARSPAKGEEDLLFRDSGYGYGGMLPGLAEFSPVATTNGFNLGRVVEDDPVPIGKINVAPNEVGEATQALRRLRERRRSSVTRGGISSTANAVHGIENRVRHMSLK